MPEQSHHLHEHEASAEELAEYARAQEQYYELATAGEQGKLFALREELGFDIDEATLRRAYETILADDPSKWEIAHDLMDATGVKPGDDTVQLAYERVINDPTLDPLVRLRDETGIQPRLTPEDVAEAYLHCARESAITSLRFLDRLREFLKQDPSPETVQAIGDYLLLEGRIFPLEQLMERFSGQVRLDPAVVEQSYAKMTRGGWTYFIQRLQKLSGIAPTFSSDDIQAGYESLLTNFSIIARDTKEFEELAGEPIRRETAEKVFFNAISVGDSLKLERVIKATLMRPEPHTISRGLAHLLRSGDAYMMQQYSKIVAALGVDVQMDQEVQSIYRDWLDSAKTITERLLEKIALLGEVTGVVPSPEVIQECLDAILQKGRFDSLAAMYQYTPHRLSAERVEKAYGLCYGDSSQNLVKLYRITGIPIPDDTLEHAMVNFLYFRSFHVLYSELVDAVQPTEDRRRAALDIAVGNMLQATAPHEIARIIRLAGISPSVERLRQVFDVDIFSYPLYIPIIKDLVSPEHRDEFMQTIYKAILEAHPSKWIDFETLARDTGIAPRFDPSTVQRRYREIFTRAVPEEELGHAQILRAASGMPPELPEAYRIKVAESCVERGLVQLIEKYLEFFGALPVVSDFSIQRGYTKVTVNDPSSFARFRELVGGVLPNRATLETIYRVVFAQHIDRYSAVRTAVGVPPPLEAVWAAYAVTARSGNLGWMMEIRKVTGQPPSAEFARDAVALAFLSVKSLSTVMSESAALGVVIDSALMRGVYEKLAVSGQIDRIVELRAATGIVPEFNAELRGSVMAYLHNSRPREYVRAFKGFRDMWSKDDPLRHHKPWGEMFMRLASVQAPSEREQYDPWKTDLEPLLQNLVTNNVLKEQSIEDGELVYEFVKEFGMYNMPTVLWWVAHARESGTVAAMRPDVRQEVEGALGVRLDDVMTANAVIQEIKKFRQDIQRDLLEDRVPERALASEAGREIIMAIRGSTQWDYDNPVEMMRAWQETIAKTPDVARLPQGYETVALDVQKRSEDVGDESARQKAIKEVLANEDVVEFLNRFDAAFRSAAEHRDPVVWWASAREAVLRLMEHERNTLGRLAVGEHDVKKAVGLKKRLDDLDLRLAMLKDFVFPSAEEFKQNPETTTRAVFDVFISAFPEKMPGRDDLLRGMSAFHILKIMPGGQREQLLNALSVRELVGMLENGWKKWNPTEAQPFNDVFTQYLNEHYLHPNQEDHDRTGHLPFSKELLRALRGAWGLRGEIAKHPLTQALAKIRAIEQSGRMKSGETVAIDLVPVRGPLRILSGDIGDACYSSRHRELARGDYPGLTAFVFVTGRGTNNERLRGSVLAIETKTEDDKKVLVVRANNPKEALLAGVDAEDIVRKTLDAMIELAKRRDCDMVVVPRDGASQAATNRPSVFDYYRREFGDREKVQLINEPATNFNGYNIWEANGGHAVVKVWER